MGIECVSMLLFMSGLWGQKPWHKVTAGLCSVCRKNITIHQQNFILTVQIISKCWHITPGIKLAANDWAVGQRPDGGFHGSMV